MQFRVIVVTHPQTHRQDRLQYTALLSLARSVISTHKAICEIYIMHVQLQQTSSCEIMHKYVWFLSFSLVLMAIFQTDLG